MTKAGQDVEYATLPLPHARRHQTAAIAGPTPNSLVRRLTFRPRSGVPLSVTLAPPLQTHCSVRRQAFTPPPTNTNHEDCQMPVHSKPHDKVARALPPSLSWTLVHGTSTRLALCHVRLCRVTPDRAITDKYVRLAQQPISPSDQHTSPSNKIAKGAFTLSNRHRSLPWVGVVGWIISTSQRGVHAITSTGISPGPRPITRMFQSSPAKPNKRMHQHVCVVAHHPYYY